MQARAQMLRKVAFRFLVIISMSWLYPNPAGATDFKHGFPVGNWGNGIRPYVRVSAEDGRLSAVFSVVTTTPRSTIDKTDENRAQDSASDSRNAGDRHSTTMYYGP